MENNRLPGEFEGTNTLTMITKLWKTSWLAVVLALVLGVGFASCDKDDDEPQGNGESMADKEHDASLYGEWIDDNGNTYVYDYYCFYSDGTGIHGSYEIDIDFVNEDEDITWYTVDDKYLYIDGTRHEYSCDGTSLTINIKGKTRNFYEK